MTQVLSPATPAGSIEGVQGGCRKGKAACAKDQEVGDDSFDTILAAAMAGCNGDARGGLQPTVADLPVPAVGDGDAALGAEPMVEAPPMPAVTLKGADTDIAVPASDRAAAADQVPMIAFTSVGVLDTPTEADIQATAGISAMADIPTAADTPNMAAVPPTAATPTGADNTADTPNMAAVPATAAPPTAADMPAITDSTAAADTLTAADNPAAAMPTAADMPTMAGGLASSVTDAKGDGAVPRPAPVQRPSQGEDPAVDGGKQGVTPVAGGPAAPAAADGSGTGDNVDVQGNQRGDGGPPLRQSWAPSAPATQSFRMWAGGDRKGLRLTLAPEGLGPIEVAIREQRLGLGFRLHAARAATADLLAANLSDLDAALRQRQQDNFTISVRHSDANAGAGTGHRHGGDQGSLDAHRQHHDFPPPHRTTGSGPLPTLAAVTDVGQPRGVEGVTRLDRWV